jgi:hypothetical protein
MSRERAGVTVRTVEGRADLRRFLEVPFGIYRDDPNWIAPLYVERTRHLDRRRNPYFQHAEAGFSWPSATACRSGGSRRSSIGCTLSATTMAPGSSAFSKPSTMHRSSQHWSRLPRRG